MIRTRLILCAQGVIRDAETNSISAHTIIEDVQAQGFPFFLQNFNVLVMFERDEGDPPAHEGTVDLNLNERNILSARIVANFEDKRINRSIVRVHGLVVQTPGVLTVNVTLNSQPMGQYLMRFETMGQPDVETTSSSG